MCYGPDRVCAGNTVFRGYARDAEVAGADYGAAVALCVRGASEAGVCAHGLLIWREIDGEVGVAVDLLSKFGVELVACVEPRGQVAELSVERI